MADRRSLWSNRSLVRLAQQFVPAADEVWRLQAQADADCVLFRTMVRGHDRPSSTTMQGFYAFSPGGELLGRRNSRRPEVLARMLEEALQRWQELPAAERRLPEGSKLRPEHRWEDSYPEGGLVLRSVVRDLPLSGDPRRRRRRTFNQDAAWFSAAEARQWVPQQPAVGSRQQLPRELALRLARFQLLDAVQGQVLPFEAGEVQHAGLLSEVLARDGHKVSLRIFGRTSAAVAEGEWQRSVHCVLRGTAVFDLASGRFDEFELVAIGTRSGQTRYNGRRNRLEPSRIGFLFQLAPAGWRVAPAFVPIYGASWVRHRR